MKLTIKSRVIFIFAISFLNITNSISINKDTQNESQMQYLSSDLLTQFFKPIEYNSLSIKNFFKRTYNNKIYAQKFLALNFMHVEQFLSYSKQSDYPNEFTKSVLKLFNQKFKAAVYVNPYAFSDFLDQLPKLIKKQFKNENLDKQKKESIKNYLYNFLDKKFSDLKNNPEGALEEIAQAVHNISQDGQDNNVSIMQLQFYVSQFLETVINKLIWDPKDKLECWKSLKLISKQLEGLKDNNIICDYEALDELYWSLIIRFGYFLDLAATDIDDEVYTQINNDLEDEMSDKNVNPWLLWTLNEREELITTKLKFFQNALISAQIKFKAHQTGLIADFY